jgi:hypothetical protein
MARLRFRPPQIEPTAELVWLLLAAFSVELPGPLEVKNEKATLALAHRLGLGAVIGARLRQSAESITLSDQLAEGFRRSHAHSAIRTALHEKAARQIAKVAEHRSMPLVFLKGFALYLSGRDRTGGRAIGDLDLLAPETVAADLHAELMRRGYQAQGEHGNEHHLATLVSPEGSNVDLHFCLRGLSFQDSRWATWEDLRKRNALLPAVGYPPNCSLPDLSTQTAHLLVHGLAHHIWRPHTYPLLQLLGDLQELLPDDVAWQRFLGDFSPILLHSVHKPELDAMRRLALDLRAGRLPDFAGQPPSDESLLLRHILAGYNDGNYARRLRLRHSRGRLLDAVRQRRLLHYLGRRVRPER